MQFDHSGGDRIFSGKPRERPIQGEQLFVGNLRFSRDIGKIDPVPEAAVLSGSFTAGGVHQNSAHGFGRGREEMPAVLPACLVGRADQSEICLVDQGRGLKCLTGGFVRHARSGKLPQFVVDEREEIGGSLVVACRGSVQKESHVGHDKILLDFQGDNVGTAVRVADFPITFPHKTDVQ
jgi:hypothetical protein